MTGAGVRLAVPWLCLTVLLGTRAAAFSFKLPWLGATSIYGSEYFYYADNEFDEENDYTEVKNRLDVRMESRPLLIGLQFRTQKYSNALAVPLTDIKD
ncbi:hypothetical protein JW905_00635 [bacterium]|nr:hypothetical protein [candidate division CSSED10-310 bacterium]